jgi:hypothetical protein
VALGEVLDGAEAAMDRCLGGGWIGTCRQLPERFGWMAKTQLGGLAQRIRELVEIVARPKAFDRCKLAER